MHDSNTIVFAQGHYVMEVHAEEHPVHGLILTEHAASVLVEPYLGNDEYAEAK